MLKRSISWGVQGRTGTRRTPNQDGGFGSLALGEYYCALASGLGSKDMVQIQLLLNIIHQIMETNAFAFQNSAKIFCYKGIFSAFKM